MTTLSGRVPLSLATTVLELDPKHKDAKAMAFHSKDLAAAQRYVNFLETDDRETNKVWINLEESSVPYDRPFTFGTDPHYWRTIVRRRESGIQSISQEPG